MNDEELITGIKSFLVLNDVAIRPGKVKEVNAILEELGIIYLPNKPDYATPRQTLNGKLIK
jgi:signal recognition particle subunit SEC65